LEPKQISRHAKYLYKHESTMARNDVGRSMEWVLLIAQLPGQEGLPAGILLLDRASDELYIKLLPELNGAPEEASEVWRELHRDLMEWSSEQGSSRILDWLETTASHVIQLGRRNHVETKVPEETLSRLYRKHVMLDLPDQQQPRELGLRRGAGC